MADDLGFTYQASKKGEVFIYRHGKLALTLRSKSAAQFLTDVEYSSFNDAQQKMARVTGNYKTGNERTGKPGKR